MCTHYRMIPPCPLVVFTGVPLGLCGKLLSSPPYQHDATRGLCRFLPICPSLLFSIRQGSKEGCSLWGFESPCYLTTSPPIPLTIYGAGACAKPPAIPPLAIPTLNGNLCGIYGTFCTCAPHVLGATRAHSAPQAGTVLGKKIGSNNTSPVNQPKRPNNSSFCTANAPCLILPP